MCADFKEILVSCDSESSSTVQSRWKQPRGTVNKCYCEIVVKGISFYYPDKTVLNRVMTYQCKTVISGFLFHT